MVLKRTLHGSDLTAPRRCLSWGTARQEWFIIKRGRNQKSSLWFSARELMNTLNCVGSLLLGAALIIHISCSAFYWRDGIRDLSVRPSNGRPVLVCCAPAWSALHFWPTAVRAAPHYEGKPSQLFKALISWLYGNCAWCPSAKAHFLVWVLLGRSSQLL